MRRHRNLLASWTIALALVWWTLPIQASNPRRTPVVDVVERVRAAVVNIHSERTVQGNGPDELFALAPSQNRVNGMGTGIIIDPRGYIITNHHVVEDVSVLRVRLADATTASARVVARDAENDLALLKIDVSHPLPTMPMGTANDVMVGETVIAIGNAYGYSHSVTVGIVSAVKRDVTLNKDVSYKQLIQTDASINPGNSGGPLLNINGELIGVNVAIRAGAQGIGFAIPVDTMIRVTADMLASHKRTPTWTGMICKDKVIEPEENKPAAKNDEVITPSSLSVTSCYRCLLAERIEANSPAAKAGILPGDTLLQVADARVSSTLEFERALLERQPGDKVAVLVRHQGVEQKLELVLQAPERPTAAPGDLVWRKLGMRLNPVSTEVVARTNQQLHGGLAVVETRADGIAARAGIQRGDILVGLHQWEMLNLDNVAYVLSHPDLASFNPIRFYIVRNGTVHRGFLQQID